MERRKRGRGRTNWHSYDVGQTLHGAGGQGFVGTRDGRVVNIRPDETVILAPSEEHWHGAGEDTFMAHDALLEVNISGTVVAVGGGVTLLRVGDAVFGWCAGAFAEYACAAESHLVRKPADLSFEQAAAVGVSASGALQLLRDRVRPKQRVLINSASGGLGSFAVQIARALGAEVTGVCSTSNLDTVRSLGAAHTIDYTQTDFTLGEQRYDYILDNVANRSLARTRRALTTDGVLQSNNGTTGGHWFGTMGTVIAAAIVSMFTRRQAGPSIKLPRQEELAALTDLVVAGKVTPLIGRTYPLALAPQALAYVAGGHALGTVVLVVSNSGVPVRN